MERKRKRPVSNFLLRGGGRGEGGVSLLATTRQSWATVVDSGNTSPDQQEELLQLKPVKTSESLGREEEMRSHVELHRKQSLNARVII